jgi:undecaprenyl pyrophosphate phosphatase UppP
MKNLFTREANLPLSLLTLGAAIPLVFLVVPDFTLMFAADLYYWYAAFLTLGGCIAAIKLTFTRLLSINPQIHQELIFETDEKQRSAQALLIAHAKTAELMIMSIALFSLIVGTPPQDLTQLLLFSSLRVGAILFILGAMVMAITHLKMRKL